MLLATRLTQPMAPIGGILASRSLHSLTTRCLFPLTRKPPLTPFRTPPFQSLLHPPARRLSHLATFPKSRPSPLLTSLSRPTPPVPRVFLVPLRFQHPPQQARGRGDNQAIFQLVIVGLRAVARVLPFLWRSGRVQQFYRSYPKSVLFLLVIPGALLAVFLVSHASFTPYSNRLHFTFLGPEAEMSLGNQAYNEVVTTESERMLPPNDPTVQQVKEVAGNILRVAVEDGVVDKSATKTWEVNVIESNVANAFVLPNGKVDPSLPSHPPSTPPQTVPLTSSLSPLPPLPPSVCAGWSRSLCTPASSPFAGRRRVWRRCWAMR